MHYSNTSLEGGVRGGANFAKYAVSSKNVTHIKPNKGKQFMIGETIKCTAAPMQILILMTYLSNKIHQPESKLKALENTLHNISLHMKYKILIKISITTC